MCNFLALNSFFVSFFFSQCFTLTLTTAASCRLMAPQLLKFQESRHRSRPKNDAPYPWRPARHRAQDRSECVLFTKRPSISSPYRQGQLILARTRVRRPPVPLVPGSFLVGVFILFVEFFPFPFCSFVFISFRFRLFVRPLLFFPFISVFVSLYLLLCHYIPT